MKFDVGQMEQIFNTRIRKFRALTYSMMTTLIAGTKYDLLRE